MKKKLKYLEKQVNSIYTFDGIKPEQWVDPNFKPEEWLGLEPIVWERIK